MTYIEFKNQITERDFFERRKSNISIYKELRSIDKVLSEINPSEANKIRHVLKRLRLKMDTAIRNKQLDYDQQLYVRDYTIRLLRRRLKAAELLGARKMLKGLR